MANNLVKGENLLSGKTLNDNVPLFAQMFEVNFLNWVLQHFWKSKPFLWSFFCSTCQSLSLCPSIFLLSLSNSVSSLSVFLLYLSLPLLLHLFLFPSFSRIFPYFHITFSQIGRRYKIMNPGKMRNTYGKLMWIIMDTENHAIKAQLKVRDDFFSLLHFFLWFFLFLRKSN